MSIATQQFSTTNRPSAGVCSRLVLEQITSKIGFKALPCIALSFRTKASASPDKNTRILGQSFFGTLLLAVDWFSVAAALNICRVWGKYSGAMYEVFE